jgi:hypothetical protein
MRIAPLPPRGKRPSRNQVPDAPPGGDQRRAANAVKLVEDQRKPNPELCILTSMVIARVS